MVHLLVVQASICPAVGTGIRATGWVAFVDGGSAMTKYLILYRAEQSAAEQMAQSTPEQREAAGQAWMAWAGTAGEAIVDFGSPLSPLAVRWRGRH
ncbi:MAG: hypothetical protein ABI047_12365 [Jatrophihabitantaceae bacterium]